jgi:hypothetical protein
MIIEDSYLAGQSAALEDMKDGVLDLDLPETDSDSLMAAWLKGYNDFVKDNAKDS